MGDISGWKKTFYIGVSFLTLGGIYSAFSTNEWYLLFVSVLLFGASLFPLFVDGQFPDWIYIIILVFAFFSIIMGGVYEWYDSIVWFDEVMHLLGGLLMGLAVFVLLYSLLSRQLIAGRPIVILILAVGLAVALGAVWEIIEFILDSIFGFSMQPSLYDTNIDLILNVVGALIMGILLYVVVRKRKFGTIEGLIKR